jgi:hypothetical protein
MAAHLGTTLQATESQPPAVNVAEDPAVMTVNGEAVSKAEYSLVMQNRVPETFNYFYAKSGMEDRVGYWKDDGQPENPIRKLRALTIDELKRLKTVQWLAKKKGLIEDTSYRAFQERLTKENARRREALANNQVIYGPKQYREERYYYFQQKDLEQALQEALQKEPEFAISDAEIEKFYSDKKGIIGDKPLAEIRHRIVAELQNQKFQTFIADQTNQAQVKIHQDVLAGIAPRHDP